MMSADQSVLPNQNRTPVNASENETDPNCLPSTPYPDKTLFILTAGAGVAVCSVIFNMFLVYLFIKRPKFRQSHLLYLAVLAVVDVFIGIFYLFLMVIPELSSYTTSKQLWEAFLSYYVYCGAFGMTCLTSASYLVVMATAERFFKTVENLIPRFHSLYQCVRTNRWKLTFLCFVIGAVFRGTYIMEVKTIYVPNCTEKDFYERDVGGMLLLNNEDFHNLWTIHVRNVVHVFIPFTSLLLMNSVILITLRREDAKARRTSFARATSVIGRNNATVRDATRMLVATVTMYLTANSLSIFITSWESTTGKINLHGAHPEFYLWTNDIVSFLTVCCGFIRLPVYCLCNTEVRQSTARSLKRLFSCTVCRRDNRHAEYHPQTMVLTTGNGTTVRTASISENIFADRQTDDEYSPTKTTPLLPYDKSLYTDWGTRKLTHRLPESRFITHIPDETSDVSFTETTSPVDL